MPECAGMKSEATAFSNSSLSEFDSSPEMGTTVCGLLVNAIKPATLVSAFFRKIAADLASCLSKLRVHRAGHVYQSEQHRDLVGVRAKLP